jgi:lysyl-tRNA synthetase class 2
VRTAPAAVAAPSAPAPHGGSRTWVPVLASWLCRLVGLVDLVSAVSHADAVRLRALADVLPGALTNAAAAATTVTGVLLLLLAHALGRRKRRAWSAVAALLALSVVFNLAKGLDVEEAAVAAVLLAGLLAYRDEFAARGDPRTRWVALLAVLGLVPLSIALGLVVVRLRLSAEIGPHPLSAQLRHVLLGLVGWVGPLQFRSDRDADVVSFTLGALGALTALVPTYLALRPAEPQPLLTAEDEARLRALLERHGGRDSLGYFALRHDKAVLWSPSGKAAVAYRVVSGVALASGDPVGDPEAWPGAIAELVRVSDEHAWVPAVMACSELGGTAYARAGLSVLEIGDEAVVEVEDFTLEGRAMRGVRQAVARVERAGFTASVRRVGAMTGEEREQVRVAAASWRGAQTERGFSMALGRFGEPGDEECVLVTAEQDGRLRALLHFVPWGVDGLSLDLMRRDREAENGLNEFLIVSALKEAPRLGVRRLSLNFAVFRQALESGERLGAGPVMRAWRGVLVFASRWFQIESLYRFNAKFRPVWEPRYVCFPSSRDLPRVALAALEAEAFLVWPRWRTLRSLRRAAAAPAPAAPPAAAPAAEPPPGVRPGAVRG